MTNSYTSSYMHATKQKQCTCTQLLEIRLNPVSELTKFQYMETQGNI